MIAIVPIRSGSKAIKDKNIVNFNGKPLVWWILQALEKSLAEKIILATDSKNYINIIKSFNFTKINFFYRSHENSEDNSTSESVLIEVIKKFNLNTDIIFCQATSPLTTYKDINKGIELYKSHDSILSVVKQKRFIWSEQGESFNYDYLKRPRRQDFKGYFVENGAIYINKSSNILKYNSRLYGNIGLLEMNQNTFIEIDELDDLILSEVLMKKTL